MGRNYTRGMRIAGVVIALLSSGSIVKAGPLDEPVAVALPAQPLGDALRELAKTSGLQLLFDPNLVAGRHAPAVTGTLAPREALRQLLRGTDLEAHEESPGVLIIRVRPSRAATAPHSGDPEPVTNTPGAPALIKDAALEEIVVTAQKREQNLQDVPISISAVSSQDLARRNISDLTDLRGQVPGLSIGGSAGANASNVFAIRGVPGLVQAIGSGQATAVYLDGVYLSRPDAAVFSLDDVERIEVLRGPQGTLYGRNATAGAINIITRDPGSELRGGLDLTYGNYDTFRARGSLSGPLAGGFSAGLSGSYDKRDGYFINSVTSNRVDDRKSRTVRGKLRYVAPDELFTAALAGDWSGFNNPVIFRNPYVFPSSTIVGLGDPKRVSFDPGSEALSRQRTRSRGLALTMTYKPSEAVDLTSVTSWRLFTASGAMDNDATAVPLLASANTNRSETRSQELRGIVTMKRLRLTLGGNYFREDGRVAFHTGAPNIPISLTNPIDKTTLEAWALFGQAELDVTDALTLVGGLRYNNEQRDFSIDYTQKPPPVGRFTQGQVKDDVLIPSAGVNFRPMPDVLLYAKVGRGYQAPGFNGFPGANASVVDTFSSETLWAYELGVKAQFLDRRVTVNAAAFHYDYKDLQVRSVTGPGTAAIDNAATAAVKGVEASLSAQLARGLRLGGQVTFLDPQYKDFCERISTSALQGADPLCSPGLVDRSGNRLNLAPKWSGGVFVDYRSPIGAGGELSINLSYTMEGDSYFTTANEPLIGTNGWERLDARVGFTPARGPEIYVYGKNLTDDRYATYGARILPNLVVLTVNDPRTYGIGVRYRL